jgi:hypothetical protein
MAGCGRVEKVCRRREVCLKGKRRFSENFKLEKIGKKLEEARST